MENIKKVSKVGLLTKSGVDSYLLGWWPPFCYILNCADTVGQWSLLPEDIYKLTQKLPPIICLLSPQLRFLTISHICPIYANYRTLWGLSTNLYLI